MIFLVRYFEIVAGRALARESKVPGSPWLPGSGSAYSISTFDWWRRRCL